MEGSASFEYFGRNIVVRRRSGNACPIGDSSVLCRSEKWGNIFHGKSCFSGRQSDICEDEMDKGAFFDEWDYRRTLYRNPDLATDSLGGA